jgi:hypothetical protein
LLYKPRPGSIQSLRQKSQQMIKTDHRSLLNQHRSV